VYCWIFIVWSMALINAAYTSFQTSVRTHSVNELAIVSNTTFAVYSVVLGVAWWMIFRGRPALKQWAMAANAIIIFNYFPVVFWNWRGFLRLELEWWPFILFGVFGIIIFSIPYHGWRRKSQIPVEGGSAGALA